VVDRSAHVNQQQAAFDYLVSRSDIDKTNIFAYGHSLGCGVAIHLTRATNAHARDLGQVSSSMLS
jgi:dienelactone hydrolase